MKSNGLKGKGGGRTIKARLKFFGSPIVITLIGFALVGQSLFFSVFVFPGESVSTILGIICRG